MNHVSSDGRIGSAGLTTGLCGVAVMWAPMREVAPTFGSASVLGMAPYFLLHLAGDTLLICSLLAVAYFIVRSIRLDRWLTPHDATLFTLATVLLLAGAFLASRFGDWIGAPKFGGVLKLSSFFMFLFVTWFLLRSKIEGTRRKLRLEYADDLDDLDAANERGDGVAAHDPYQDEYSPAEAEDDRAADSAEQPAAADQSTPARVAAPNWPVGWVELDMQGRALRANELFESAFEVDEPVDGQMLSDLIDAEVYRNLLPLMQRAADGKRCRCEIELESAGKSQTHDVVLLPLDRDANSLVLVAAPIDQSVPASEPADSPTSASDLMQNPDAQRMLLQHIGRQMETPAASLMEEAESLKELISGERPVAIVDQIHRHGSQLLDLVSDVIDHTLLEADELTPLSVGCSPAQIIEEVAAQMKPAASIKDLELLTDVEKDLPESVVSDPGRIRRILCALLKSSITYSDSGEIRLSANCQTRGDKRWLRFVVVDSSAGMDPEDLSRLFHPPKADLDDDLGNWELGLGLSRRLAKRLDGDLTGTSMPGQGNCFTLILPLEVDEPSEGTDDEGGATSEDELAEAEV